jgi:hypothetical protein
MLGSTQRLQAECRELAGILGVPARMTAQADEITNAIETQGQGREKMAAIRDRDVHLPAIDRGLRRIAPDKGRDRIRVKGDETTKDPAVDPALDYGTLLRSQIAHQSFMVEPSRHIPLRCEPWDRGAAVQPIDEIVAMLSTNSTMISSGHCAARSSFS